MLKEHDVHATLPAEDLGRARRFYTEKLGLEVESEDNRGIFFRSGKNRIYVFTSNGRPSGSHTQVGWSVKDIEGEVEELKSKQVQFEEYDLPNFKTENGIVTVGEIRSAWFHDSEGNLLGIVQLQPARSVSSGSDGQRERRSQ